MQRSDLQTAPIQTSVSAPQSVLTYHSPYAIEKLESLVLVHSHRRRPVRTQNAIELAILEACRTPLVQHWVMVKARLGYETFWTHMNKLLSLGMMDETNEGNKTFYRVSSKGLEMLSQLDSSA
ncbi:MAG: winged helix-turn-helix domain-containing protein [Nitrososphaerales archaeon]